MTDSRLGTAEQLRDPDYTPPLGKAIPLGIQHVLAMFVSNVTPAIIVAGAAGIGFGSDQGALGFPDMTYLIQMSILFAGIATLIQTIGMGPIGARLPIVQGTSFAFLPVMIPAVAGLGAAGLGGLMTGVIIGGLFHMIIGTFVGKIRFALPPLVTGLIVLMIGLALVKVGIQYAAGGVPLMGKPGFGTLAMWFPALVVIAVTLALKFFTKGMMSVAAVLIGIIAGYIVALFMGQVNFSGVGNASLFELPNPFRWGFELNWAIIIGMCLMAVISAIETVGDVSGITKGGAGREATDEEITGATYADGVGTAIAGIFGGLPNTSFSQNVGLISMTGVMSRGVVTIGAIFLIICGLIPMVGAIIRTVPINVLGGGVIIMFGMVTAAGASMLSAVNWNRRNMVIFATALSVGLGLQLVPDALQHLGSTWKILLTSGLLPAAAIAILLNLFLPEDAGDEDGGHETQLSGLGDAGDASASAGAGYRAASNTAEGISDGSITASTVAGGAAAGVAAGGAALASGLDNVGDAASSAGDGVAKVATKAAKKTSSAAKSVAKSTSGTTSKVAKKTSKKAKAAGKSVSNTAKATGSKAEAKSSSAAKTVSKKASTAATKTRKAGAKATSKRASTTAKSGKAKLAGSAIDDLEFVDGVGPKTAKSLKSAGVKNLSGLVAMSDTKLEAAAEKAGTGGRPKSENWKGQAKSILAGKPPRAKSDRAAWERAKKKMG